MNPKVVAVTLGSVIFIVIAGIYFTSKPAANQKYTQLDAFAQCLRDKQVTMYGAAWCSHCQAQKKLFGDSFKYVPYVECPDQPDRCLQAKVESYPTWLFPDGNRVTSEQDLAELARLSGCILK